MTTKMINMTPNTIVLVEVLQSTGNKTGKMWVGDVTSKSRVDGHDVYTMEDGVQVSDTDTTWVWKK